MSEREMISTRLTALDEAGFDILVGTEGSRVSSDHYRERAYLLGRAFVAHILAHPVQALEEVTRYLYGPDDDPEAVGLSGVPRQNLLEEFIQQTEHVIRRSESGSQSEPPEASMVGVRSQENGDGHENGEVTRVSAGALLLLKKHLRLIKEEQRTMELSVVATGKEESGGDGVEGQMDADLPAEGEGRS